jgi:CHAT domain-containing protein
LWSPEAIFWYFSVIPKDRMIASNRFSMSAVVFHSSSLWQYLLVVPLFFVLLISVQAQDRAPLVVHTQLQKRITSGETHNYQFPAQAKSYVRFTIHRSTSSIVLGINDTKGQQVASLKCLRCESTSLSVITTETGNYQISIRSEEAGTVTGKYDIELAEIRPTVAKDSMRLVAERTLTEGDLLQVKWSAATSQKALDKYRSALRSWQLLGERTGQSVALQAIGDIYSALGEQQKALDSYQQAYMLAGNQARLKAKAALGLGFTSIILGESEKGVEYGTEALTLSKAEQDRSGEAKALLCIGDAHFYLHGQGIQDYENALLAAREGDDLAGQAKVYSCLGFASAITPEKQTEAFQYQEKALQLWRLLNDKRGQATTLIVLGHLASLTGNKQQALTFYHEAESSVIGCGESDNEARLYAGLGFIHEGLGEQQTALQYYLKALTKWRMAKFRVAEVEALTQIGRLYREMGENNLALNYLLQAKNMAQVLQNSPTEAWVYAHLGLVYADLGREKEALSAYQKALDEKANAIPWIRALALNGTGRIHQRHGNYQEAKAWYNKALRVSHDSHEPFGEVSTLTHIARAERDSGNLPKALKIIDKAIASIEALRVKIADQSMRASYFASTREAYELSIDILMQLSAQEPDKDHLAHAFEISERARARSLLDVLVESRTDIATETNPVLLAQERSLIERIAEKNRQLAQLYANDSSKANAETADGELNELIERQKRVQSLIRAANPRYAELAQPKPSNLQEIQQLLDAETVLLEYSLSNNKSYLWAITANSIAGFQLPSQSDIEKVARQVYESLIAPNQIIKGQTTSQSEARLMQAKTIYPQVALRLSQMVLAPAISITGKKRMVIIADGALQYIPFAALPNPQKPKDEALTANDFHPLVEQYEIINMPSASTLSAIRREQESRKPAAKTVAVIADPVFNREDAKSRLSEIRQARQRSAKPQPYSLQVALRQMEIEGNKLIIDRLVFSHEEATAILLIAPQGESLGLLNFQANKQAVMTSALNQYRFIHFATHGLLDSNRPELSKLILSLVDEEGKSLDGLLQLHEIYNLKLPAELVVLSACQTALGKEIKGEGLVGLTRGFMYAGAARVVASLWNVNDAATADLMSHFYKYMLQEKQRPAEALRNAQLKMLQQKKWKSPYYWAAFTIQGEWK